LNPSKNFYYYGRHMSEDVFTWKEKFIRQERKVPKTSLQEEKKWANLFKFKEEKKNPFKNPINGNNKKKTTKRRKHIFKKPKKISHHLLLLFSFVFGIIFFLYYSSSSSSSSLHYYLKICKHNMKCFNCICTSTFYFNYEIWHHIFVVYLFILLWWKFLCARYLRIWNLHSLNFHLMCANKYLFIFWSLIWTNQMNSYTKY
jgi:hypothetical protein